MPQSHNVPHNVPHPRYIVEAGNIYYLAMYEDKKEARECIERLRALGKTEKEKEYIAIFEASAIDVAKGLHKNKDRYDRRVGHFEQRRNKEMERAATIRGIKFEYIVDITERLGVGAAADIMARALEMPGLWPEAIGAIATLGSHFILRHYGKRYKIDTVDDYATRVRRIDARCYEDMSQLEKWSDNVKRKLYFRAEHKLSRGFTEIFGIEIEEEPSASLYDGVSKMYEARSMKDVWEALETSE